MQRTPITAPTAGGTQQLLANLAVLQRTTSPAIESHYDVQPVIDVYAAPDRRDLGGFAADVSRIIDQVRPTLPRGTTIDLRGQVDTMQTSFTRLGLGMIFAVVLVYLVMAVNFQSWSDPFIILMALPGRDGRHALDVVPDRDHAERTQPDGSNHVHRCRHRQQHPAGDVRQR